MKPVKTECPKCGKTIVHEFVEGEPDEDTLCLLCRAWIKNNNHREQYIKHMENVRPEDFKAWVKRRREHGHPVDTDLKGV